MEPELTSADLELTALASRFPEARPAIVQFQVQLREFAESTSGKRIYAQLAPRRSTGERETSSRK